MLYHKYQSVYKASLALLILSAQIIFIGRAEAGNLPGAQMQDRSQQTGSSNQTPSGSQAGKPATGAATKETQPVTGDARDSNAANGQTVGTVPAGSLLATVTPLTPGQKFKYFARSSFYPPTPYALSVFGGVFSEATDNDHGRHMTVGDFLADSMTHAARGYAFYVTSNFFGQYAYATALKQDPRYFRSNKKGLARLGYAVSRVFVTRGDNGNPQFNTSFVASGLTTAGISNVWSRKQDRTLGGTMGRFGLYVAYGALSNVVLEWFGKR